MASYARDIPVLVGAAVTESEPAYGHLVGHNPVMRYLVRRLGQPEPFGRHEEAGLGDNFSVLVRYSVLWPFHAPSTCAVHVRTRGESSAVKVADPGAERLAAPGMPAADADRLARLARLARAQLVGDVNLDMFDGRNDRQIREILGCSGMSRRVTDRFLIRRLHQPDVLPADDPVLARVVRRIWALGGADDVFVRRWAPFRTYAAALLWALSRDMTSQVELEGAADDGNQRALPAARRPQAHPRPSRQGAATRRAQPGDVSQRELTRTIGWCSDAFRAAQLSSGFPPGLRTHRRWPWTRWWTSPFRCRQRGG
ncbi:hypothetical protein AB0383_34530 [Amycolatopsis sp. NPDC051373]|uniref:hypothetical protein n=1 Tax=Amycolatopsis sp. NPDC051373 TaxID=3155801 RepID=UPI00344DC366